MEELRSGKLAVKKAIPGINRKAPRVLIAGGCQGLAREKALEFRRQGCRVAVFDSDEATGKQMAHDHGIRFHRVDISDENALRNEMPSLLSAWRGVDIIVGKEDITHIIDRLLQEWRYSQPLPDKNKSEIVII